MNHSEALGKWVYNAKTGVIYWRKSGKLAGGIDSKGYIQIKSMGKNYRAHRLAWFLTHKEWPIEVDHINQIKTDNRIENLRSVNRQTNLRNARLSKNNTSGVTGVRKSQGKWIAQIKVSTEYIYLGIYKNWFDAVCARKAGECQYNFHPNHGRGS